MLDVHQQQYTSQNKSGGWKYSFHIYLRSYQSQNLNFFLFSRKLANLVFYLGILIKKKHHFLVFSNYLKKLAQLRNSGSDMTFLSSFSKGFINISFFIMIGLLGVRPTLCPTKFTRMAVTGSLFVVGG